MPRQKRRQSKTGIYHVMVRGNEKQTIFNDDEDKKVFIALLRKCKEKTEFDLYAYCLMKNHFHLVIKESEQGLSRSMKILNVSYARYFNKKYDRVGHVFQGRYKSEPIEDERYFLAAVRYVHNNPLEAKLVEKAEDYVWSSYSKYLQLRGYKMFIDKDFLLEIFSKDRREAIKLFDQFTRRVDNNNDKFLDVELNKENKNVEIKGIKAAKSYIDQYIKNKDIKIEELSSRSFSNDRIELVKNIRSKSNLSIRDIAQILGLSKYMVNSALKNEN